MNETAKAILLPVAFFGFFFVVHYSSFNSGWKGGRDAEKCEAIEAGAAEWRVDAKTGETSFHYKSYQQP